MKLELHRTHMNEDCTIGELYVDGVYECLTLEDLIRDVKIFGETAIPAGTYKIIINHSPKFNRLLPRLLDVPGFTGILIHKGNTKDNTHGCILVGSTRDGSAIRGSTIAFEKLYEKLWDAVFIRNDELSITITNNF